MRHYHLYGTSACHLCEQAEQHLRTLGLTYSVHDIVDDAALYQRYQLRIPVLVDADGRELDGPFSLLDLLHWTSTLPPHP